MEKERYSPITETTLFGAGFIKNRNLYTRGNCNVELIKGHTWIFSSKKVGEKDLAGMAHLLELIKQSF